MNPSVSGLARAAHLPEVGVGVDPRPPRGAVQKGQRDHDVAAVLALVQDRRRGQSSSRSREASSPEPIDEDRRRM